MPKTSELKKRVQNVYRKNNTSNDMRTVGKLPKYEIETLKSQWVSLVIFKIDNDNIEM